MAKDASPPPIGTPSNEQRAATPGTALQGIGVSPGVAFGTVHLIDRRKQRTPKHHIADDGIDLEVERLRRAIAEAGAALAASKERAPAHAAILDAHLLMMEDPLLLEGAIRQIRVEKRCAEWAVRATVHDIRASRH